MRYVLPVLLFLLFSCSGEESTEKGKASKKDAPVVVGSKRDTRKEREILAILGNVPKERFSLTLYECLADPAFSESEYLATLCDISANAPAALRATKIARALKRGKMIDAFSRDFYRAFEVMPNGREPMFEVLEKDGRFSPVVARVNFWGVLLSGTYMHELSENRGSHSYALISRFLEEGRLKYPYSGLELAEVVVTDTGWIYEFPMSGENRVDHLQKLEAQARVVRDSIGSLLSSYGVKSELLAPDFYDATHKKTALRSDTIENYIPLYFYFGSWWADSVKAKEIGEVQRAVVDAGFTSFSYEGVGDWFDELPTIEVTALDSFDLQLVFNNALIELTSLHTGEQLFVDSLEKRDHYNKLLQSGREGLRTIEERCQEKRVRLECSSSVIARNLLQICELLQKSDAQFRLFIK